MAERHPTRRLVQTTAGHTPLREARGPSQATTSHEPPHEQILLSARDDSILRALGTYGYLTVEQVVRLFYQPGSLAYVRARLKRLADASFAQRLRLPSAGAGNTPWVYTLASKGLAYLKMAGIPETELPNAVASFERSYFFLSHTLAVNDVLIAAVLLSHHVPEVVLAEVRTERFLRHAPVRVQLAPGEKAVLVIPDAWLNFHLRGTMQLAVALEVDRGTEEQKAFKHKIQALLAYASGPYQQAFGTTSITIAIATTAGETRAKQMRRWCEQVLQAYGSPHEASLFLLTAMPHDAPDPRQLFLAPIWQQPFANQLVALVALAPAEP